MKIISTIIFILQSAYVLSGQNIAQKVDTICIYKNKCGVPFKLYKRTLFPKSGSFSFSPADLNKQDSIVLLESQNNIYLKVFNSHHTKLFEGEKSTSLHGMSGDVIFYRKNATVKRIETWANSNTSTADSLEVFVSDSPSIITTTYYSGKGIKTKQIETIADIYSTRPLRYCIIKRVIRFRKSGISSIHDKKISCEK